jgi:exodeoxyribonuclease V alpha subunit
MSLLRDLHAGGWLRALDHAFAASLRRLDPDTPDAVLAAAALASRAVANGHSGLRIDAIASLLDAIAPQRPIPELPDVENWLTELGSSRWVGAVDAAADCVGVPLVLERGRLYLRRYWKYEVRLANALRQRATPPAIADGNAELRERIADLFAGADPRQALAALLALSSRLTLITGGPGTGKTSAVAALLVLLRERAIADGLPSPRIALAAPTGKAAARLSEALGDSLDRLHAAGRIDAEVAQALRLPAQTVHRLLGWRPRSVHFRHDAGNPLPADVVVIDEASMVDLPLMCKLVEAVAPAARLLLLGDRDQLASVDAGDVLAALCDAAGDGHAFAPDVARAAAALIGAPVPERDERDASVRDSVLTGHRIELVRSYRQDAGLDLAPLAAAVRDGDADAALAGLRAQRYAGVHWHVDGERMLPAWLHRHALPGFRAIAAAADPTEALRCARKLRILTALRQGPVGNESINALIAGALQPGAGDPFFHGRLLIVTENSYRQGLFNGDTGVVFRAPGDGGVAVWFETGDGLRAWTPSQLPAHASAWALTVHKAQGSEFDRVLLALPDSDARVLGRELLYTGITRCRSALELWVREDVLRIAIERRGQRDSGLSTRFTPSSGATG